MTQISRLRNAEITNGNLINADDIAAELNQLVTESNGQDTRLTTLETGTMSISGNKTFSGNNTFSGTAAFSNTVTLSGTINLTGQTNIARSSDPGTPVNGDFWYNSTSNVFKGQVNGATRTLATTADFLARGYLAGLTLSNNVSDANNDIDIAVGACRDATNAMNLVLSSVLTKQSDAAWAVGSNAGGMDTGTKPTSGTLHVFLIKRSDTGVVDVLFSASATSPTMPTNYDYKRRIGSVVTDSSGNILGFMQYGDRFEYKTPPALDVDVSNQGTSAVTRTLTVPTGLQVIAIINIYLQSSNGVTNLYLRNLDLADLAASVAASPLAQVYTENGAGGNRSGGGQYQILTSTAGQISTRSNLTGVIVKIATVGWIDRRGKDD